MPRKANFHATMWLLLILLGIGLRLVGIDNSPLDHHHIRQADTASIAEIMRDSQISLFWPTIGWAGAEGGIVESEFPIYTALTACGWRLWPQMGYLWPRLLSILMWGLGGLALYRWVKRHVDDPIWPLFILYALSPLAIITSRNIQPDALAVACLLWGLNTLDRSRTHKSLIFGSLIFGLGIAAKGQYFVLLPMVPFLLWHGASSARRQNSHIAIATLIAAIIPALWYLHAHFNLGVNGATFGVMGPEAQKWGSVELWISPLTWLTLLQILGTTTVTPLGCFLLLPALLKKPTRPLAFWLGVLLCMMGWLILTEGHLIHNYYQLPLIPFASVLVGLGLKTLWHERRRLLILVGVPLFLLSLLVGRRFIVQATTIDAHIRTQAAALNAILPPKAPIVLISTHPQTLLHASGRKGAIANHYDPQRISDYAELGIQYIVLHQDQLTDDSMHHQSDFTRHEDWLVQQIVRP